MNFEEIVADPYNWPFPKRQNLMSLQTINQRDVGFPKYELKEVRQRNFDLSDIRGASPEMRGYKYNNKETFVNRIDDIDGSSPKQLIKCLSKPDFQLNNKDIKGAQPQINKFQTTRQPFNPLQPQYQLPKAEVRVSTPPKFIRDNINIDDIEGTKPNPKFFKTRNVDIYTEIEGSKPKNLFIPRDHIDILDVKDINEFLQFKTTRHTNPLNPTYIGQNDQGEKIQYGHIDGSLSRRLHPEESKKVNFNLTTNDIKGAWHGTHTEKFLKRDTRKDFRVTNITKDLPEAQVGSLKKGIITNRHVNPLVPKYQLLGEKEGLRNFDGYTNPMKEQSIVNASKTMQATSKNQNMQQSIADTIVSQNDSRFQKKENNFVAPTTNLPRCQSSQSVVSGKRSSIQSTKSIQQDNIQKPPTPQQQTQQVQFPKLEHIDGDKFEGRTVSRGSNAYNLTQHVGYPLTNAQKLDKFIC
ncbi:hypothetical protein ABPG74_011336 [Tetrahymena malaccensis]